MELGTLHEKSPCIQAGSGTVQEALRLWLQMLLSACCWWLFEQLSPLILRHAPQD